MTPKFIIVAELLKKRILNGDYALKDLPTVRELAAEVAVGYVTAQQAYVELERQGVVSRLSTGRLEINRNSEHQTARLQLAFLTPTFGSPSIDLWRTAIEQVATARACQVRPVLYTHWDDPHLTDVLTTFDGVFLSPLPTPIPGGVLERLRKAERLVVLDENYADAGIPSLIIYPPVMVQNLLDHLKELGHRHIDCLNVQPMNPIIQQRLEQWHLWMAAHRYPGRAINEPVAAGTFPYGQAYEVIRRHLTAGTFRASALLCLTLPAAIGAMHAFREHGLRVGGDVSICAVDGEDMAQFLQPTVTCLAPPDPVPFINNCLDWLDKGGGPWSGPLLMQPRELTVVGRESTRPVVAST